MDQPAEPQSPEQGGGCAVAEKALNNGKCGDAWLYAAVLRFCGSNWAASSSITGSGLSPLQTLSQKRTLTPKNKDLQGRRKNV